MHHHNTIKVIDRAHLSNQEFSVQKTVLLFADDSLQIFDKPSIAFYMKRLSERFCNGKSSVLKNSC